jgi:hypothetical protein
MAAGLISAKNFHSAALDGVGELIVNCYWVIDFAGRGGLRYYTGVPVGARYEPAIQGAI